MENKLKQIEFLEAFEAKNRCVNLGFVCLHAIDIEMCVMKY